MTLVCIECDTPHMLPVSRVLPDCLFIRCQCGAVYEVSIRQVEQPTENKRKEIAKERASRIVQHKREAAGGPSRPSGPTVVKGCSAVSPNGRMCGLPSGHSGNHMTGSIGTPGESWHQE